MEAATARAENSENITHNFTTALTAKNIFKDRNICVHSHMLEAKDQVRLILILKRTLSHELFLGDFHFSYIFCPSRFSS